MHDLWNKTLDALSRRLPAEHFGDLVRSVVCTEPDPASGSITLQVNGRVQRDWISEHYLALLHEELAHQAGQSIHVQVEVVVRDPPGRKRPAIAADRRPPAPAASLPRPSRPLLPAPEVPASVRSTAGTAPRTSSPPPVELDATPSSGSDRRLNPRYRFDSFVVGTSNQMAHAAAVGVARSPGKLYNPLFLYGSSGLGKTHLLQAVAHEILRQDPTRRVVHHSTEGFINDFTGSIRNQRMDHFRLFYREECDLLLLDDVQFMSGKEQTQQEFFHTFEALYQRGAQIVMTCDRLPKEIDKLDERLGSRFTWGLLADIQAPELETRIAILHKLAEQEGFQLADEVALFLANGFRSNIRELEGSLTRLIAYASISGQAVTLPYAREVLKGQLPSQRPVTTEELIRLVAEHYQLKPTDLKGDRRQRTVARPRQLAMYLARTLLAHSYPEIGRAFGRDHTTVIAACQRIQELLPDLPELQLDLEQLQRRIAKGTGA